jgi:hypothetical protein
MSEFPDAKTVGDAMRAIRAQKAAIDALGGEEGIDNLNSEVADYRKEIDQFAQGDPGLIEQLYEGDPKGVVSAAQNILELLGAKNMEQLDTVLLPHLANRLQQVGFVDYLVKAAGFCKEGKGQEAYDTLAELGKWWSNLKKDADGISQGRKQRDPREEEFQRRGQEADRREREFYDSQINTEVTRHNNTAIRRISAELIRDAKLKGEGLRDWEQNLLSRVLDTMRKDKAFQSRAKQIKAKGDVAATSRFINDKFMEVLPTVFRAYKNLRFPAIAAKKSSSAAATNKGGTASGGAMGGKAGAGTSGNGAGGSGGGALLVQTLPKRDQIDWTKTTDAMYHIGRGTGEAVLKDGKRVKWDWTTVQRQD